MKSSMSSNSTNELAIDVQSVNKLRTMAKQNSPEALKETAKQFEVLFINMMLKSMRDATPDGGLFASHDRPIYTSMLDQQYSQNMAQKGLGLADMLVAQLIKSDPSLASEQASSANAPIASQYVPLSLSSELTHQQPIRASILKKAAALGLHLNPVVDDSPDNLSYTAKIHNTASSSAQSFTTQMQGHAQQAEQTTGIPSSFILAQAAIESGWGKREITKADGSSSHNVFGIKAGNDWKGPVAEVTTTEYIDGEPKKVLAKFRAYDSHAEAFQDYAAFLANNPRYKHVLANSQTAQDFAHGLQQAGYATDPAYASKLLKVIQRVEAG
jgi:peptidoglycan hydrolase FlgJ